MFPLPYNIIFSRKLFVAMSISVVSVVLAGTLLYQVSAQGLTQRIGAALPRSTANKVYLGAPAAGTLTEPKKAPFLEMHIANNGLALLRGATVLSISGGTLRVGMTWGSADFAWKITTDSGTKFLTTNGKETIDDIAVGDIVTVTGILKSSGTEPVIEADYVRE